MISKFTLLYAVFIFSQAASWKLALVCFGELCHLQVMEIIFKIIENKIKGFCFEKIF